MTNNAILNGVSHGKATLFEPQVVSNVPVLPLRQPLWLLTG